MFGRFERCCASGGPFRSSAAHAAANRARGERKPSRRGGQDKPKSKKSDVATLLLFRRVRELALYRAEVLRHHGYEVIIPHTKAEAISVILAGGFDAAILTYTLSTETVEELADLIRQNCPNCPVICVSQSKTTDARIRPDEIVLAEQGPPGLIGALRRVLRRRVH